MKKIFVGLIAFVVINAGISIYTGIQIKQSFDQSITETNSKLHLQGFDIQVISYKKGLFSSDLEMNIGPSIPMFSDADERVGLYAHTKIYHGPILFRHGFGFGYFSSKTQLMPKTSTSALNKMFQEAFGESLGNLYVSLSYGHSLKTRWELDAIQHQENSEKISIEKSFFDAITDLKTDHSVGQIQIGSVHWENKKLGDDQLNTSPIIGQFDLTKMEDAYTLGSMELKMEKINLKKTGTNIDVKQILIGSDSKIVGKAINTTMKFEVSDVSGLPFKLKNLYYHIDLNQISIDASKKLAAAQKELEKNLKPEEQSAAAIASLLKALPEFLQPGLALNVGVGGNYQGEEVKLTWSSQYHPLSDGKKFSDITDPKDYLLLVDSEFHLNIPKSLGQNLPITQFVGGRVTENEKNYLIDATLKDGQLVVGSETLDITPYLQGFAQGFSKGKQPVEESVGEDQPETESTEQ